MLLNIFTKTYKPKQKPEFNEKVFIDFLSKQGILVKTNTRARGNMGICFKNRIDISKKVSKEKRLAILAHEYAHKIHLNIEKDSFKNGGSLEKLFKLENTCDIEKELMAVTNFVDENSTFIKFQARKFEIDREIKLLESIIKKEYPDFKKSYPLKPINSYFRKNKSPAKYLLRYDRIKIVSPVFKKEELYSIKDLDKDFSDIPESLRAYIKLKALQREYKRLYRRKNKAEKYYKKPTELFARLVEGIFTDKTKVLELAPLTYIRFFELLEQGHYGKLKQLFNLAEQE